MAKVKIRVIAPAVVAAAGGPEYAEGTVEVESEVAETAVEWGGAERVGRPKAKPTAKPTAKKARRKKA